MPSTALTEAVSKHVSSRSAEGVLLYLLSIDKHRLSPTAPRSVHTLVAALHRAGGDTPELAKCPRCNYPRPLKTRFLDGSIGCSRCAARESRTRCSGCGVVKQAYRTVDGAAWCKSCCRPPSRDTCSTCGTSTAVWTVVDGRIICLNCRPKRPEICHQCGLPGSIAADVLGGRTCFPCYRKMLRKPSTCPSCGDKRILSELSPGGIACCASCAGVRPRFACVRCRSELFHYGKLCARCTVSDRLEEAIGGGTASEALAPVREHLTARNDPNNVLKWITNPEIRQILSQMASGEIPTAHSALNALPQSRRLQNLRRMLVQLSVLPATDVRRKTLEAWAALPVKNMSPHSNRLLTAYFRWSVMRRLGSKLRTEHLTEGQSQWSRVQMTSARELVLWIEGQGRSPSDLRQTDVDKFFARHKGRHNADQFVLWLGERVGRHFEVPIPVRAEPTPGMTEDARLSLVRNVLQDHDANADRRLISLLVASCGQSVSRVVQLPTAALHVSEAHILIRFGDHDLELPHTFRRVVEAHIATRGTSDAWLFPGRFMGEHRSRQYIDRYIRSFGVTPAALQTAARYHLGGTMPAKIMADSFGFHLETAIQYARLSGGTWRDAPALFEA